MVATRKTPVAPAPASRTTSTQPLPRPAKAKSSQLSSGASNDVSAGKDVSQLSALLPFPTYASLRPLQRPFKSQSRKNPRDRLQRSLSSAQPRSSPNCCLSLSLFCHASFPSFSSHLQSTHSTNVLQTTPSPPPSATPSPFTTPTSSSPTSSLLSAQHSHTMLLRPT